MRLQDLGFPGFGYAPWGVGTTGVANPGSGNTAAGTGAGASSGINVGASSDGSALSNSLAGSAAELAVVRESETLKIQLTDGSQVTIRVRAQGAAFGAAQTQSDGSSSSTAAIFASGQLQVAVDGNLSSADMQAISDVVSQVSSLATQFFSGDTQDAFAAAASLNIDPSEIAGFSMKLSYSGLLVQQASASGASPGAGDTTTSIPTGDTSTQGAATGANTTSSAAGAIDPSGTTASPDTTDSSGASVSSAPAAGTAATGTAATGTPASDPGTSGTSTSAPAAGSAASSTTSTSQVAANAASPQQSIINFIQTVMAKLGRGSVDSPSQLRVSSRWKLHLMAQALPAYAQAQVAGATAAATPAKTTSTLQAARLAADTLSQLAQ